MNDSYIDSSLDLVDYLNSVNYDKELLLGLKTNFTEWNHPSIVLINLYEIQKYKKRLVCIQSDVKSGQSTNTIIYLLDSFVKQQVQTRENGFYLIILSATRESSQNKYNFVQKIIKRKKGLAVVDINEFFPLKSKGFYAYTSTSLGKPPQIVLPPTNQATILLGTPQSFLKLVPLASIEQSSIFSIFFDECKFMEIFNGEEQIRQVYEWITSQKGEQQYIFVSQNTLVEKICNRKPTLLEIDIESPEEDEQEDQKEQNDTLIKQSSNYFYHLAKDEVQKFIITYITLKLNLFHGKTLILVENLDQIYKMQIFLQRCGLEKFQIYNSENPKSLKYYVLSTFNTGVLQTLVATPQIIQELKTEFFERSKSKSKKKKSNYSFKNLDNIVVMDIDPNGIDFNRHLSIGGNVLVVQKSYDEQSIENTIKWINDMRKDGLELKQYPLSIEEIEAFRYRIEDVLTNISRHQVKTAQTLDFKKKMLKSPDLEEYFKEHPKEKELLQQQVVKMKALLKRFEIKADGVVPDYLLPQIIQQQRKMQNEVGNKKFTKVLVSKEDIGKQRIIEKRRLLAQNTSDMLPKPLQEEEPKKKIQLGNDKFVYVNEQGEDPELVDPSRLQTISSRKLWKLKHGFKLKKRNKRMERKGVFDA